MESNFPYNIVEVKMIEIFNPERREAEVNKFLSEGWVLLKVGYGNEDCYPKYVLGRPGPLRHIH